MAVQNFQFKKEERLCSEKLLNELFTNGSSFLCYPFRVTWLPVTTDSQIFPIQVVISVPKKRFKLSVHRNLIKRRIKEAYRLNKSFIYEVLDQNQQKIVLGLNYVGKEIHEFPLLERKLIEMFKTLEKQVKS